MTGDDASFEAHGLRFRLDCEGVEVAGGSTKAIEAAIDPSEIGFDGAEPLAEQLAKRLSRLLGQPVIDDEGIYDLAVEHEGVVVAAIQLSCGDDDELEVLGERRPSLSVSELRQALAEALRG